MDTIILKIIAGAGLGTGAGLVVGLGAAHLIVTRSLPDQYATDSIAWGFLVMGAYILGGVGLIAGAIIALVVAIRNVRVHQTSARR